MLRQLSPELENIAKNELNEDAERREEDLKHIREWIKKQPHLTVRMDDQWLITFLRGCKFSLQRTKEKIDNFHTMRTLLPEFYTNRDPFAPEIQEILRAGIFLPLPHMKNTVSPRIFMVFWKSTDPNRISMTNIGKVFYMIMDILMNEDDNCAISGVTVWEDFEGFDLNYLFQWTPSFVKKFMLCLQNTYPIRVKGIYLTNVPLAFEATFNLCKSFVSDKMKERFCTYSEGNFGKLYNHIPKNALPKDFGGDNESVEVLTEQWKKKIEGYREWFLNDAKYCTNEELRTGSPKTVSDVFGVEGSFRKLTID